MCKIVLALDQALETSGYGVFENNNLIHSGTFKVNKDQEIHERLVEFAGNLSKLHERFCFDFVAFEGIQYQNNAETHKKLAYVQATLILWCYDKGIRYTIIPPSAWRCELGGGFGKTRKEQKARAIEYVKERFGTEVTSDEADAICIGCACISILGKERDQAWTPTQ